MKKYNKIPNFYRLAGSIQDDKSFFSYIRKGTVFELCIDMNYFTESTDYAPDFRKEISKGEYVKVKNKAMIKKIVRFLQNYKLEEEAAVDSMGYCC